MAKILISKQFKDYKGRKLYEKKAAKSFYELQRWSRWILYRYD